MLDNHCEKTLSILIENYKEIQARIRENKARLENTTTSILKTFIYSTIIALVLNASIIITDKLNFTNSSSNTIRINIEIFMILLIMALWGSIIGLISHYIWRIGNMTYHLADVASLLCLEEEISSLLKNSCGSPVLSRTFIENISVAISPIISQLWPVVNLSIPIWISFIILYIGYDHHLLQEFSVGPLQLDLTKILTISMLISYLGLIFILILRCWEDSQKDLYQNNCNSCTSKSKVLILIIILMIPLSIFPLTLQIPHFNFSKEIVTLLAALFFAPLGVTVFIISILGYVFYRNEILPMLVILDVMKDQTKDGNTGTLEEILNCAFRCILSVYPTCSEFYKISSKVKEFIKLCDISSKSKK